MDAQSSAIRPDEDTSTTITTRYLTTLPSRRANYEVISRVEQQRLLPVYGFEDYHRLQGDWEEWGYSTIGKIPVIPKYEPNHRRPRDDDDSGYCATLDMTTNGSEIGPNKETAQEIDLEAPFGLNRWSRDESNSDMDIGPPCRRSQTPTEDPVETPMEGSDEDENADDVLSYVLQVFHGIEWDEVTASLADLRDLVGRFIQDVGSTALGRSPATSQTHSRGASSAPSKGSPNTLAPSSEGASDTNSQQQQQQGTKRKRTGLDRQGNAGGDDGEEDGDSGGLPHRVKRPVSESEHQMLRLSCPFRKRNPARFNVREHYSCAMTYFPKFAELR